MAISVRDENREDCLAQALEVLEKGGLLCLPTETVYGIGCREDRPGAVERLRALKLDRGDRPFTLHLGDPEPVFERGIGPPPARRLARTCWPGPMTLVLEARHPENEATEKLGFRVVDEAFTAELLRRGPVPLLLSSANRGGGEPALEVSAAEEEFGDGVDLYLETGPSRIGLSSTVVEVDREGRISVPRVGALPRELVLARAARLILFLCSGNTCRSPMAEALARRRCADCRGVEEDRLLEVGFLFASAGCMALPGHPPSEHAVTAMREVGIHLGDHRTRPLEPALLLRANQVFCMASPHLRRAQEMLAGLPLPPDEDSEPPQLLGADREIEDPFGGSLDQYRRTRDLIQQMLNELPDW